MNRTLTQAWELNDSSKQTSCSLLNNHVQIRRGVALWVALLAVVVGLTGCLTPVGTQKSVPAQVYDEVHENAISGSKLSPYTLRVLRRFDLVEQFDKSPRSTLQLLHQKAIATKDRDLVFALSELNYLAGERIRHSVKAWEPQDDRDYYLASAVYAWFFMFDENSATPSEAFDLRFRTACDFYNYALSRALSEPHSTNATAVLEGGARTIPLGQIEVEFRHQDFPWPMDDFEGFLLADHFKVRGLSVRNRQPGLGAPLVGTTKPDSKNGLSRCVAATVFLRLNGNWADLSAGRLRASLELYSAFDKSSVEVAGRSVPLQTDTTVQLASLLNQSLVWRLGMMQFLSFKETIANGVYLSQPYEPGKVPVVFVHGTFSSPVWWAEMVNTLSADPEIQKHCQFWQFIYNSGSPTALSAAKLRESLTEKVKSLDPDHKDPGLQQMVVIGHSQGGLLTKMTATDTGDTLLRALLKTNKLENLGLTPHQQERVRHFLCLEALPFVKSVIFISTPHRGSYLAGSFARRLARKLVTLPSRIVNSTKELAGLTEKFDIPKDLRGIPTSLDSMSPRNPIQLALADIPLAPGVKGHSIIAVKGDGDYHQGKDGLVAYSSAHVDYVESEFIVRGPHSCQGMPSTIEEVRRILREHLATLPAEAKRASGNQ
jgi:pimeloyl-ACP methyl ester carboxylesterase